MTIENKKQNLKDVCLKFDTVNIMQNIYSENLKYIFPKYASLSESVKWRDG